MEDATKAIWLAIGAMLFIIGLTTAIIMYSNMIHTVNTTLSVNDTKTNVVEMEEANAPIIYTPAESYFLLTELQGNENDPDKTDDDKVCTPGCFIPNPPGGDCNITYNYSYNNNVGINDLNNHKISAIQVN